MEPPRPFVVQGAVQPLPRRASSGSAARSEPARSLVGTTAMTQARSPSSGREEAARVGPERQPEHPDGGRLLVGPQPQEQAAEVPDRLRQPEHVVDEEDVGDELPVGREAGRPGTVQREHRQRDVDAELLVEPPDAEHRGRRPAVPCPARGRRRATGVAGPGGGGAAPGRPALAAKERHRSPPGLAVDGLPPAVEAEQVESPLVDAAPRRDARSAPGAGAPGRRASRRRRRGDGVVELVRRRWRTARATRSRRAAPSAG